MGQKNAKGFDTGVTGTSIGGTIPATSLHSGLAMVIATAGNRTIADFVSGGLNWVVKATGGKLHLAIVADVAAGVTTAAATIVSDIAMAAVIERDDFLLTDFFDVAGAQGGPEAAGSGTGVTVFTAPTVTPSQADSLVITAAMSVNGSGQFTGTPHSGFTPLAGTALTDGRHDNTTDGDSFVVEWKVLSAAAAQVITGGCADTAGPYSRTFVLKLQAPVAVSADDCVIEG